MIRKWKKGNDFENTKDFIQQDKLCTFDFSFGLTVVLSSVREI